MTAHEGWDVLSLLTLLLPSSDGAGGIARYTRAPGLLYLLQFGVGVLHDIDDI